MRNFSPALRQLLVAQIPADFADWFDYIAVAVVLGFVFDAPPVAFALFAVALTAPAVLIGPLIAGRVDQSDLRRVMIWSNLGRAGATAALAFAGNWQILLCFVALRAAVDSAYTPAKQAALQASATEDNLMRANQVSQGVNQASKVLAPSIGGLLVAVLAPKEVFFLNAVLSCLAALLLLRFPKKLRAPANEESLVVGLRSSLSLIRQHARLRGAITLMAVVLGATFLFDTLIVPHLKALGFSPEVAGYTVSASGLGMIAGMLVPMRETPAQMRLELGLAAPITAGLLAYLGLAELRGFALPLPVLIAVFFGFGCVAARVFVPLRVILQRETPSDQMARVGALSEAANTVALMVPPFIGAAIAQASSTGWSFLTAAGVFLVLIPLLPRLAGR